MLRDTASRERDDASFAAFAAIVGRCVQKISTASVLSVVR